MGSMPSIGLVLGAGGVVGGAYNVGALAALAEATGWDARTADLIVGTSAGAGIAATLRIGFSPGDHYRRAQDLAMSDEGQRIGNYVTRERVQLPDHPGLDPLSFLRPTAPWLLVPAFLAPGPVRPGLLAGLLPRGRIDPKPLGDRIRDLTTDRWPAQPTWIVAVRLRDGKRTVFGREDVDVPDLGVAVEASSAVPSYFKPVRIGDHEYFDGGAFSCTNADLVASLGYDLVVIVSPMSAVANALDRTAGGASRVMQSRTLAREVAAIRERGTKVLVIQPTRADIDLMGTDWLANEQAPPVARRAHDSVLAHLDDPEVADRVEILRDAATQAATTVDRPG